MLHHNHSNTAPKGFHTLRGLIGLLFLGTAFLIGCEKPEPPPPPPELEALPNSLTFPVSGGEDTITVKSNIDWTLSCDDEEGWLAFSARAGSGNATVVLTAAENAATSRRTATVTVSGGGITQTVSVLQRAIALTLTVSETSLNFDSSDAKKSFSITSNTSWEVSSNASWLSVSPSSGTGDGTVTVSPAANPSRSKRTATITVSADGITRTVRVAQEATAPFLTVSETSLSFPNSNDTKSFAITSNTSWKISSGVSWLSISPSSGYGDRTVSVRASTNDSGSERTATITVSGDGITRTISATQAGIPFGVYTEWDGDGKLFVFPHEESGDETLYVYCTTGTSWTARSNAAWLTVSPSSGTGDGRLTIRAAANPSASRRKATITVSGGGSSDNVSVEQYGVPEGSAMFWTASNNPNGYITVTLSGHGTRTITGYYYQGAPSCGDLFTATFPNLRYGTYSYTATDGSYKWSGTITVSSSCSRIRLSK